MTAEILLFDGYVPNDPALKNSHWMAERTRESLGEVAVTLTYPDAIRENLESHLGSSTLLGLTVFGHGDAGQLHTTLRMQYRNEELRAALYTTSNAGAVYGSDEEPALDLDNLGLLRGRWCHALACSVGLALPYRAIEAGASCFVAYESALTPEYETDTMPEPLRSLLAALVTTTTLNLYDGVHDKNLLQAHVKTAILKLEEWLESDDGIAWCGEDYMQVAGLRGLAQQLWRDMVVSLPDAPMESITASSQRSSMDQLDEMDQLED